MNRPSPIAVWLLLGCMLALAAGMAAAEKSAFKRLSLAIFKMDGKQVRFWEVYQAEKHGHLVLVQIGRRSLLLDTKAKEILEIAPGAIEQKSKEEVVWTSSPDTEKQIASDDWVMRSVGPMVLIKVLLSQEGRQLELQLPRKLNTGWFY
jgi:hypothetical protein